MDAHRKATGWRLPLLYLIGAGALLGISTNLGKMAGNHSVPPLAFLTWSVAAAGVLLFIVQLLRGDLPSWNRQTVIYFLVAGLITIALSNLILYAAIPRVGAGFVSLTITFPPLLTYLGALLLGMEQLRPDRAFGVLLALAGAGVLAAYKLSDPGADMFWISLTFAAPVLLAVGNLYRSASWPEGESAAALAPGTLVAAALLLFLAGGLVPLLGGNPTIFSLAVPFENTTGLLIIAAQTVTLSVQFLLFFQLQETGGPVYLSLLGSVGAVVGVPVAVLLLGENWPEGIISSGILILLGVGLLTYGGMQQAKRDA